MELVKLKMLKCAIRCAEFQNDFHRFAYTNKQTNHTAIALNSSELASECGFICSIEMVFRIKEKRYNKSKTRTTWHKVRVKHFKYSNSNHM